MEENKENNTALFETTDAEEIVSTANEESQKAASETGHEVPATAAKKRSVKKVLTALLDIIFVCIIAFGVMQYYADQFREQIDNIALEQARSALSDLSAMGVTFSLEPVDSDMPKAEKYAWKDLRDGGGPAAMTFQLLYIEPHHGKHLLNGLWELGDAIQRHLVTEITYEKLKGGEAVQRVIEPVGLMFSEYYFYLVAFIRNIDRKAEFENPDDLFPTIYRVDRIRSFRVTDEHFQVPYLERFQEGEFRKRVQFMYGGRLQKIRFQYTGPSIEAVLDRLPTAEVEQETADGWIVKAEAFGKGIDMWLRSQGEYVQVF